jgi:signal transduction histidine kinase
MFWNLILPVLSGIEGLALPVAIVALTVSGLVVVSGLNRRRELLARQGEPTAGNRFELGVTPFVGGELDVAAEARDVLRQVDSLAAQQLVDLEFAIQPDLTVRADRRAFREMLSDLLRTAIEQAPCGHVLLGAGRTAGRVDIVVSDDGGKPNREMRLSKLRSAERLAALHGATMEVDVRIDQGTTVTLRLPVSENGRRAPRASEPTDPQSIWGEPHKVHVRHDAAP